MAQKTKIIYILPEYNSNLDGHIFYLANFVQEITKDLDVFLIIEKSKEKWINIENIKWFYIQKFSNILLRTLELFFIILYKRFFWYRIAYIHYSYIWAIVSSIIMRCSFWKTFYWSCGMMWLFGKQPLLKISLHLVNHLVTWANALKKWYSKNYGISENKILIMPNWIELNRLKTITIDKNEFKKSLWFKENEKIILFLHRLAERKWIQYVSKIAEKFRNIKNIKFLVIGDGPYRETLLEEKKNWNLDNILYIGKVPNKDVYNYFLISDVFLMPSEEEWFPRVLLESMACNVPYVASDIWWVKEISPEWQQDYIYKIGDINGFTEGIHKLSGEHFDFSEYIKKYDISEVKNIFFQLIKNHT